MRNGWLYITTILVTTTILFTRYFINRPTTTMEIGLLKWKKNMELVPVQQIYHLERHATNTTKTTPSCPKDPGSRPTTCDNCFKRPYPFILISPNACRNVTTNAMSEIDLLVVITSIVKDYDRRQAIRLTWLSVTRQNTHPHVRHVFLFGHTNDEEVEQLKEGNKIHHDLVQQSFRDSYRNLTLKTLMGLEWVGRFCPTAKYIMKTDDDMFVNVTNILRLTRQPNLDKVVLGRCWQSAKPIRNITNKWYASKLSYPEDRYPAYCSGTGYVMSAKVASDIVRVSSSVPFFHLEDVYTGMCVKLLAYNIKGVGGFNFGQVKVPLLACASYASRKLYTSHGVNPRTLNRIWLACGVMVT